MESSQTATENRAITIALILVLTVTGMTAAAQETVALVGAQSREVVEFSQLDLRKTKQDATVIRQTAEELSSLTACPSGCLVLVVFANKQADFIHSVDKAVQEAVTAGVPVKALIYARALPAQNTINELKTTTGNALLFFAAGSMTSVFVNIKNQDAAAVFELCQDEIRRAYLLMQDALKAGVQY